MELADSPSSDFSPSSRRRAGLLRQLAAGLLPVLGAVAGIGIGQLSGQSGGVPAVGLLVVAVGALSLVAARAVARPSPDLLRVSGRDALRNELDRARRHRRTFALARLRPIGGSAAAGAMAGASGGIAAETLRLIGASLRITDRAWLDDDDVVLLLPEADRATADALADRLRQAAPDRFTADVAIAVFPDDGLTSGALLEALDREMHGDQLPSPLPRTAAAATGLDASPVGIIGSDVRVESGVG